MSKRKGEGREKGEMKVEVAGCISCGGGESRWGKGKGRVMRCRETGGKGLRKR